MRTASFAFRDRAETQPYSERRCFALASSRPHPEDLSLPLRLERFTPSTLQDTGRFPREEPACISDPRVILPLQTLQPKLRRRPRHGGAFSEDDNRSMGLDSESHHFNVGDLEARTQSTPTPFNPPSRPLPPLPNRRISGRAWRPARTSNVLDRPHALGEAARSRTPPAESCDAERRRSCSPAKSETPEVAQEQRFPADPSGDGDDGWCC